MNAEMTAHILEALMILCFGLSWPISIRKSYIARTAKGKSLMFEVFIWIGYVCGTLGKIINHNITYVFVFYIINFVMVTTDLLLYVRNSRLDKAAEQIQA